MQHGLRTRSLVLWVVATALALSATSAHAQSCQTSGDLDDATRAAITAAAERYFNAAAKGDTASLRQNAVPTIIASVSDIESLIRDYQPTLAGAQSTVKAVFQLETEGNAPIPHAEFYCGIFGKNGQTSGSAVFYLDNLAPGKYAVAVLDAASPQAQASFSVILQQAGTDWKLGGLYIKPAQVAGHDSEWFVTRAREYKKKDQLHNAWLFYLQARSLTSPLPFMSTLATDKLYDESQGAQPADVPANGKTADLSAGGTTYKVTALFPEAVGKDLDLIVKYQTADASNASQCYQSNTAVIKALVTKYPEMREAFAAVVARAVDPTGRDYGTLLAMKDIK